MSKWELIKAAREFDNSVHWAYEVDGLVVSKMMVCQSAAGYYPGRLCFTGDSVEPYCRAESWGYRSTEEAVQQIIDDMIF